MSKTLITTLVISILGFGAFAQAQETRKRSPLSTKTNRTPEELEKNISIKVEGALSDSADIALTITGCGRMHQAEAVVATIKVAGHSIPILATITFGVRPLATGYIISYSIGSRLPIATAANVPAGGAKKPPTVNVSHQNVLITGDVRIKPAETLEVFKAGDQSIKLTVTELE